MLEKKIQSPSSAAELAAAFGEGSLTPTDALAASLERIRSKDAVHRAVYTLDVESSAAASHSLQRWAEARPLSPLDGVPVTVKENTAKAGLPQSFGTAARTPRVATENSPLVDRLLEAGAVVVANTTMPDLSALASGVSSRHGIARNAWNPAWNTGGSSSGAAVATALGYAPINVGTDIGGSIRIPAAMNGVFGFKPSYGRVPIRDTYAGRCAGPMSRTVRDAAAAMVFLARPDSRDHASLPPQEIDWLDLDVDVHGMRIGLNLEPVPGTRVDPVVEAAVRRAASVFQAAGAHVEIVEPFLPTNLITTGWVTFLMAHLWAQLNDPELVDDIALADQDMVTAVSRADSLSALDLIRAIDSVGVLAHRTVAMLGDHDAVLSPTTSVLAMAAESRMFEFAQAPNFTSAFNASGTPAATINCGFSPEGKPIGLQIACGRFQDLEVLRLAEWYERRRGPEAAPDWARLA